MNHPVLLKGNSIGLTMVLDPEMKFEQLKAAICEKFTQAKDFFNGQTQIALKIEGRKLTSPQLEEVLGIIAEETTLTIAYVIEDDKIMETSFKEALRKLEEKEQKRSDSLIDERRKGDGQFYRGTLRSGQSLESDGSVVVVGDVNPGASVSAKGNVVVLGCAKGYSSAGNGGDDHAFVAALDMQPMQIRIGNHIARSADGEPEKKKKFFGRSKNNDNQPMEAQIAFVEDENIYIEPISKALLNEIIV